MAENNQILFSRPPVTRKESQQIGMKLNSKELLSYMLQLLWGGSVAI